MGKGGEGKRGAGKGGERVRVVIHTRILLLSLSTVVLTTSPYPPYPLSQLLQLISVPRVAGEGGGGGEVRIFSLKSCSLGAPFLSHFFLSFFSFSKSWMFVCFFFSILFFLFKGRYC